MIKILLFFGPCLLMFTGEPPAPDGNNGRIYGFLYDSSRTGYMPVSLATVSLLKDDRCTLRCNSSDDGSFEIKDVKPGMYTLHVTEMNHLPYTVKNISLREDDYISLRLRMRCVRDTIPALR